MLRAEQYRNLTRNILRYYRAAGEEMQAAGREWYDLGFTHAERLGWLHGYSATRAVVALAHLSPRTTWTNNLLLTDLLLGGHRKPSWALSRQWAIAKASLRADDPLESFSRRAVKTRSFAQAFLGDRNAVVVDAWAARVAGVDPDAIRSVTGYHEVANGYIAAARRAGEDPRAMQAITWCEIRAKAH